MRVANSLDRCAWVRSDGAGRPSTSYRPASTRRDNVLRLSAVAACESVGDGSGAGLEQGAATVNSGKYSRDTSLSRRRLFLAAGASACALSLPSHKVCAQEYQNSVQGYDILIPDAWEKVDKAGADVLFRDPNKKSTTVGVTVYPVRVQSIAGFGTLQDVEDRLIAAEKAKDGFFDVRVVSRGTRTGQQGAQFYSYSYELNTSRGRKRIVTAVTITNSKLFIVNGTCKCGKESCGAEDTELVINSLTNAVDSFDVV